MLPWNECFLKYWRGGYTDEEEDKGVTYEEIY
jgi:hypothetical protein